jgi:hypothetical protein
MVYASSMISARSMSSLLGQWLHSAPLGQQSSTLGKEKKGLGSELNSALVPPFLGRHPCNHLMPPPPREIWQKDIKVE